MESNVFYSEKLFVTSDSVFYICHSVVIILSDVILAKTLKDL